MLFKKRNAELELINKMIASLDSVQQNNQLITATLHNLVPAAQTSTTVNNKEYKTLQDVASLSEKSEEEKIKAAYALNLCTVSVSQIIQYNDLKFMEHEYEAILNNLNLERFPKDEPLLKLLKQLLDVISFYRLQDGDKAMLDKEYQLRMKNAIWSAVPNFGVIVSGGNPVAMGVSLAAQVGIGYMNYRKEKAQISLDKEKEEWKLQRSAMEQLHGLQRELFDTAWRLADEYNFKDEYRLTERQIRRYNDVLTDTDSTRRYERLFCMKDNFVAYPPFWYYLGNAANDAYHQYQIERYKEKACEHFELFMNSFERYSLLREDHLVASCALEYCDLISNNEIEKRNALLKAAIKYSGGALDVLQLCALAYLKMEDIEGACVLFKMLVNEQYNLDVNAKILSRIYVQAIIENKMLNMISNYQDLCLRASNVSLFPLPEETENYEDLSLRYISALKEDLCNSYITTLENIIYKYEYKYNSFLRYDGDISDNMANLLQELLTVVQEFLVLDPVNVFSESLRNFFANSNNEKKFFEMIQADRRKNNRDLIISFCKLCSEAFLNLCDIIVSQINNLNNISEISSHDVRISQFCNKYNLHNTETASNSCIDSYSLADKLLGTDYEKKKLQTEQMNACYEILQKYSDSIVIDSKSKYKLMKKNAHDFAAYINKNKLPNKDKIVGILLFGKFFDQRIIFTSEGAIIKNKEIPYGNIRSGNKSGKFEFYTNSLSMVSGAAKVRAAAFAPSSSIKVTFDTNLVNVEKLSELFIELSKKTGSYKNNSSLFESKELVDCIRQKICEKQA